MHSGPFRKPISEPVFITGLIRQDSLRRVWLGMMALRLDLALITLFIGWHFASSDRTAVEVSLVQVAVTAPMVLFLLPCAYLGDILTKRTILVWAGAFCCLATAAFVFAAKADLGDMALLAFFTLMNCGHAALFAPGQAALYLAAGRQNYVSVSALNNIALNLTRVLSGLIALYSLRTSADLLLGLALILSFVLPYSQVSEARHDVPSPQRGFERRDFAKLIVQNAAFCRGLVTLTAFTLPASAILALLPTFVARSAFSGGVAFGMLSACFGLGALLGSPMAPRLAAALSTRGSLQLLAVALGIGMIALPFTQFSLSIAAFVIGLLGLFWTLISALLSGISRQQLSDRVQSTGGGVYLTVSYLGLAIGSLTWGLLADLTTISTALCAAGGWLVVANWIILRPGLLPEPS